MLTRRALRWALQPSESFRTTQDLTLMIQALRRPHSLVADKRPNREWPGWAGVEGWMYLPGLFRLVMPSEVVHSSTKGC